MARIGNPTATQLSTAALLSIFCDEDVGVRVLGFRAASYRTWETMVAYEREIESFFLKSAQLIEVFPNVSLVQHSFGMSDETNSLTIARHDARQSTEN